MLSKEDKNKGSRPRLVFVTKLLRIALNSFFKDREFYVFFCYRLFIHGSIVGLILEHEVKS